MYRRVTNEKMQKKTQTTYLLRRDVKGHSSQIHLHKVISARQNKEKSWKDAKTLLLFFVSSQQVFQQFRPSYTGKALVFLCINYFLMFVFTLIKFNINFSPPQYMLFWRNWTQCTMHQLSKKWFRNTFNPFIQRKPAGKSNIFQLNNTLEMLLSRF